MCVPRQMSSFDSEKLLYRTAIHSTEMLATCPCMPFYIFQYSQKELGLFRRITLKFSAQSST